MDWSRFQAIWHEGKDYARTVDFIFHQMGNSMLQYVLWWSHELAVSGTTHNAANNKQINQFVNQSKQLKQLSWAKDKSRNYHPHHQNGRKNPQRTESSWWTDIL
jgi:hypothetical protein